MGVNLCVDEISVKRWQFVCSKSRGININRLHELEIKQLTTFMKLMVT